MKHLCKNCKYFLPRNDIGFNIGNCRRFPPIVIQTHSASLDSQFPEMIGSEDWCGEFQHKIKKVIKCNQ